MRTFGGPGLGPGHLGAGRLERFPSIAVFSPTG
jgi:hypothetical protein